jgi:hypothetical protein
MAARPAVWFTFAVISQRQRFDLLLTALILEKIMYVVENVPEDYLYNEVTQCPHQQLTCLNKPHPTSPNLN